MARTALIISGGTARGAYAAGLLNGLFTRFPELHRAVSIFSGTSTGSLIAPALALYCLDPARHHELLELIVRRYQVPSTEAFVDEPKTWRWRLVRWLVARFKDDDAGRAVGMLGETGAVVDASPLWRTVEAEYTDGRLSELFAARDRVQVYVNCVSAQTGGLVAFSSADEAMTPARYRKAIFASCMQPFFMPLVPLDFPPGGPQELMDGGVRDVVPVEAAFYGGATRALALALFPDGDGVPAEGSFAGRANLLRLAERVVLGLLDAEVMDDDVLQARLLATIGRLVQYARAHGADAATLGELVRLLRPEEQAQFLGEGVFHALYVHRPSRDVPLVETLRWDAEGMRASIEAGRAVASGEEGRKMYDFLMAG
ncbi:MAG: patatin-like phospholipase family protein [Myxococcota bacterium]|jgi:predicted acylesterase/phospholipase RssA